MNRGLHPVSELSLGRVCRFPLQQRKERRLTDKMLVLKIGGRNALITLVILA